MAEALVQRVGVADVGETAGYQLAQLGILLRQGQSLVGVTAGVELAEHQAELGTCSNKYFVNKGMLKQAFFGRFRQNSRE